MNMSFMSLQVRNGYEIKEVRTLGDLELFFKQVRSMMQPIYEKMRNIKLIEQAVSIYDEIYISGEESLNHIQKTYRPRTRKEENELVHQMKKIGKKEDDIRLHLEKEAREYIEDHTILSLSNRKLEQETEEIRSIHKREVDYDFDIEICFFFENHRLFATVHTEREEYIEAWEGIMNVRPYSYWETSTVPSGITKEEWFYRKMVWRNIFSESAFPKQSGIILYPIHEKTTKQKELKVYIPSFETRVKNKSLQQRNKELEAHIVTYIDPNRIMEFAEEFMERKVSEEWKNRLEEIQKEVSMQLNPTLTIRDLIQNPNKVLEGR